MAAALNGSKWFDDYIDAAWKVRGDCGQRPDLPWTDETQPDPMTCLSMGVICDACPVRVECADYAVNSRRRQGVEGGFYAGVWLPWRTASGSLSKEAADARARARTVLRRIARSA